MGALHPSLASAAAGPGGVFSDEDAKLVVARRYGFGTWRQLKAFVALEDGETDFQTLACLSYFDSDRVGNRERAQSMLKSDPTLGNRDIWSAACVGDARAVAAFLDADPSLANRRGGFFDWEPLLYACYSRLDRAGGSTLAVARLLVERGADPDAHLMLGGQFRFTALTGAFGEGEMGPLNQPQHPHCDALARLLLDAGADPNDGQALYNTMFTPGSKCLEMLLEYGLSAEHRNNWLLEEEDGQLVKNPEPVFSYQLRWAVRNHHVERAKLLIDRGADLSIDAVDGRTLHLAAMRGGHAELAQYLAEHGAPVTPLDIEDRFAAACMSADEAAARTLLESQPDLVALVQKADSLLIVDAAGSNRLAAMRLMLALGFDPNTTGATPSAPLHQAAFRGHLEMVKLLLDWGAEPDARDVHHDGTPLEWAAVAGQAEVEAYLAGR